MLILWMFNFLFTDHHTEYTHCGTLHAIIGNNSVTRFLSLSLSIQVKLDSHPDYKGTDTNAEYRREEKRGRFLPAYRLCCFVYPLPHSPVAQDEISFQRPGNCLSQPTNNPETSLSDFSYCICALLVTINSSLIIDSMYNSGHL